MDKIIRKFLYYILAMREKTLSHRLSSSLKHSYKNKTTKTILSATEHVTLSAETEKIKTLVRKNVEDIVKNCANNPYKLLEYIEAAGTNVYKINNADKILSAIGEEEGIIFELKGLRALYINLFTTGKFSLYFKPAFIMREGNIEPLYMIQQFYKWYSLKNKKQQIEEENENLREEVYKTILSIDEMQDAEVPVQIKAEDKTPEECIELSELKAEIIESMKKLPPRERELIEYKFFKEKKLREIAEEFNISQSRISRIIQSGLDKIKRDLKRQGII